MFEHFWTISVLQPAPSMQHDTITIFSTKDFAIEMAQKVAGEVERKTRLFADKYAINFSSRGIWESK